MSLRPMIAATGTAVLAASALMCAQAPRPPAAPAATSTTAAEVGRVGDTVITLADVDRAWTARDPAGHTQAVLQLYDGRREVLEQLVGDALIEQAARAKGQTAQAFLDAELPRRRKPVTDASVDAFYTANRERMQGQPVEVMRAPIRQFLERQATEQARDALVAELKGARPGAVRVRLDPPRAEVPVAADDPVRGPKDAPIEIVEFSDFQCPFCGRVTPTLQQVMDTYGTRVKLVFKDFPLPNHTDAPKAAEAAHCAGEQGKYWEMHDRLFANQQALKVEQLRAHGAAIGLDPAAFNTCLDADKYQASIQADLAAGQKLGVNSTPSLFINGRLVMGAQPLEALKAIIDEELELRTPPKGK